MGSELYAGAVRCKLISSCNFPDQVNELTKQTLTRTAHYCVAEIKKGLIGNIKGFTALRSYIQKYISLNAKLKSIFGEEEAKKFIDKIDITKLLSQYRNELKIATKTEEELKKLLQNEATKSEVLVAYTATYLMAMPSLLEDKSDGTTLVLEQFHTKLQNLKNQRIDLGFEP